MDQDMNALDQAFIKAFAKDRTPGMGAKRKSPGFRTNSSAAEDVESGSAALDQLSQGDKRLRLDRPAASDHSLAPHAKLPPVEHHESFDLADVPHAPQLSVVVEDRLGSLDDIHAAANQDQQAELKARESAVDKTPGIGLASAPNTAAGKTEHAAPSSSERRPAEHRKHGGAMTDAKAETPRRAEDRPEHQLPHWSWPHVQLATAELDAPNLVTSDFGYLERAMTSPAETLVFVADICVPEADLAAIETETCQPPGGADQATAAQAAAVSPPDCDEQYPTRTAGPDGVSSAANEPGLEDEAADCARTEGVSTAAELGTAAGPVDSAPRVSFAPAWEVDALRWPQLCRELDEKLGSRLGQAGNELFAATQDGLKVLAVTSHNRLEGRTTAALALARSAAMAGARVALVDADAFNPQLSRRLGMEAPCDWSEVVRRGDPLSEAAVASLEDGVMLFPTKWTADHESAALDQPLLQVLAELKQHFDLVIIDLPPAGDTGEPSAREAQTACPVDMAVVVRNVRETSVDQCLTTVAFLRRVGVRAVGVIENFIESERAGA